MTIIIDGKDWWVEYHVSPTFLIPAAASATFGGLITLDRPGHFVGGSIFFHGSAAGNNALNALGAIRMASQTGANLNHGTSITGVQAQVYKVASASAETISVGYLVFMSR